MDNRIVLTMIGYICIGSLALAGCSVVPAGKAEVSSPAEPQATGRNPATGAQESTLASSMEAFRSGGDIPTDKYSPVKDVYFDFDRYSLRLDARKTLKANAEWLRSNPSFRVVIEGHTDERGTDEYNLALGAQRAQAVKDYLVTLGISPDRISTISYGEELPTCQQKTEKCWQSKRRAHSVASHIHPSA